MAKSAINKGAAAPPAAAPTPVPASPYTIQFGEAPPPAAAFGGGNRGAHNPIKTSMENMPAPNNGKYAFFDIAVTVAASITDPAEKEKAASEALKKMVAKVSGVARRISKTNTAAKFAVRGQRNADGTVAVRVWRVEVPAPAPATA